MWTLGEMMSSSVDAAYLGVWRRRGWSGATRGYGAAYTIGTGAGPLIGGAVYASAMALWAPGRRGRAAVRPPAAAPPAGRSGQPDS